MAKDYFKFRFSWGDGMSALSYAEKGRLLEAVCQYAQCGEAQTLTGNERFMFRVISAELDKDQAAFKKRSQSNKENIKKRWKLQNDTNNTNRIDRTNSYASACARVDDHDDDLYSLNDKYIYGYKENEENEGWYSFVKEYEQNIGSMPNSLIAVQELQGYYERLGAEVIREAVRAVALAYPANLQTYFTKVCREWIANGVRTAEDANAQLDRWRKKNKRGKEVKPIDGSEWTGLSTVL